MNEKWRRVSIIVFAIIEAMTPSAVYPSYLWEIQ